MKIFLGTLVVALLASLAVSMKQLRQGMRVLPKEEVKAQRQVFHEMEMEWQQVKLENARLLGVAVSVEEPAGTGVATVASGEEIVVDEADVVMDDTEEEAADAPEVTVDQARVEALKEARRKAIVAAKPVGVLKEWVDEPNLGQFAVIEVEGSVKVGTVLAIRRNGGVLGKLKVSRVDDEGVLADALTIFGEFQPQAGDELIVDP